MKKITIFALCLFYSIVSFSQLTVSKKEGSSVVTKLGMVIKVNDGSSLKREQTTINDASCPIQLSDIGVETSYSSSSYSFKPTGSLTTKEPIVAYEVTHLIYNVFGEHMKTLSNTEITDIDGQKEFSKYSSWYASENNVSEYLICVSYVSNVRTKSGKIWHYNFKVLKDQLNKLEISFEEGYLPKKDNEKEK
jgi:archaellin